MVTKKINLLWDGQKINISDGFIKAIENLMIEELKMMQVQDSMNKEFWQIGVCYIGDIASSDGLNFLYSSKEYKKWMKKEGQIYVELKS